MTTQAKYFMNDVKSIAVGVATSGTGGFDKTYYDQTMEKLNRILVMHNIETFTDLLNGEVCSHLWLRAAYGIHDPEEALADDEFVKNIVSELIPNEEDRPTFAIYLNHIRGHRRVYMVWDLPTPNDFTPMKCYMLQVDRIFGLAEKYNLDMASYGVEIKSLGQASFHLLVEVPIEVPS